MVWAESFGGNMNVRTIFELPEWTSKRTTVTKLRSIDEMDRANSSADKSTYFRTSCKAEV